MDSPMDARAYMAILASRMSNGDLEPAQLVCNVLKGVRHFCPDIYDGEERSAAGILNYYRKRGARTIEAHGSLHPGCLVFFRKETTGVVDHVQIHLYGFENGFDDPGGATPRGKYWHGPRAIQGAVAGCGQGECLTGSHAGQTRFTAVDPVQLVF